ncbi:FAD-dependent monooxygenase [Methylophilaceae bacterium]|nr:FAD-dependent monooxygenase [Methylophilaceae bacterium]
MVNDIQNKIIIIGGGLIGELLHMMLKSKGFEINHFTKDANVKNRTFALSPSSVDWLRSLGLPSIFFESLSEIKSMKIFDSSFKNSVTLNADDAQKQALAYMANEKDFDEAIKNTRNNKNLKKLPTDFNIQKKQDQAILKLPNGEYIASVIIACDGANSKVREKIAIDLRRHNFNQTALSFELKVKSEIQKQAFQFFLKESILAVLPIRQGLVSIVWSCNSNFFTKLNDLDDKSIENELSQIIGNYYKDIKIISKKESFPLFMNSVESIFKDRVLLVGDSAHFIHPMAGQGLNLGIRDIISLEKIIDRENYLDIGLRGFLRKYERARKEDVSQMGFLTLGLNWIFSRKSSIVTGLVEKGMGVLDKSKFIKQQLIKKAIS